MLRCSHPSPSPPSSSHISPALTLEVAGARLVVIQGGLEVVGLGADEQQQVVLDVATEDLLGALLGELDDQRKSVGGDEGFDGVSVGSLGGQGGLALIKLREINNRTSTHVVQNLSK